MPRRVAKKKNEEVLRDDLAAVHALAHRMRKDLITDMAELEWENNKRDLSCLHTAAVVAAGLIEIEVKTGELIQAAR